MGPNGDRSDSFQADAPPEHGSQRDLLNLLDSGLYVSALNRVLAGATESSEHATATDTVLSECDAHRPVNLVNWHEWEVPMFCREHFKGHFDQKLIEEPIWWIIKRTGLVRTPNIDFLSTATIESHPGLLIVEAKAHVGELEIVGKRFNKKSSAANHNKIGESIQDANTGLNTVIQGWRLSRDRYYQLSNRIAWAWRLASLGVPVTVLYLGFLNDPHFADSFYSGEQWQTSIKDYMANVVPTQSLAQRMPIGANGSLAICAGSLDVRAIGSGS
jgi:hypothetical protein